MNASWYAVKKVDDDKAEVSIYDEIGLFGITAKEFANELKGLGKRRIILRIHSPGGEIFEGQAIYNALRRHPGGVDVAIDGLAASMASVIAMAGENRRMAENAMFMIHNPWSIAFGDAAEMRKNADLLDTLKETIISAYAGRTGMERSKLSGMMDYETWLTADESLKMGFVTEITEPLNAYNSFERFDISKFHKRPTNFMSKKTEQKVDPIEKSIPDVIEEAPVAEISDAAKIEAGFQAMLAMKDAEIAVLKAELVTSEESSRATIAAKDATIDSLKQDFARLEVYKGVAAAAVVVKTPVAEQKSVLETFNSITDDEERTTFWKEHKTELGKFIQQKPA